MSDVSLSSAKDPSGVEIVRVPSSNALSFLTVAFKIFQRHYGILIPTAIVGMLILVAMSKIPIVEYLAPIATTAMAGGVLVLCRKLLEGKDASVKDMFAALEDQSMFMALFPLGIVSAILTWAQPHIAEALGMLLGSMVSLILSLLLAALTAYSVPLIVFRKIDFQRSIVLNLKAMQLNWEMLLIFGFMVMGAALMSLIALVLPFFLVFIPVMLVANYLTYAAMFEGLDIVMVSRMYSGPSSN